MKIIAILCLIYSFNSYSCQDPKTSTVGSDIHPDIPLNNYAAGHLSVIKPTFGIPYLIVAYRYLNNLPLNKAEQIDVVNAWNDGFSSNYITYDGACAQTEEPYNGLIKDKDLMEYVALVINHNKAYFNWREARLNFLGLPVDLPKPPPAPNNQYTSFEINSFYTSMAIKEDNIDDISGGPGYNYLIMATERLKAIKEALDKQNNGINNNNIQNKKEILSLWISAQQNIFRRTVAGSEKARELLAKLPNDVPQLLKDDVKYAIAASYLYEGSSESAITASKKFASLAKSTTYPWHEWAKYLQYRALYIAGKIKGFMSCEDSELCTKLAERSYKGMLNLSQNATNTQIKDAAEDYLNVLSMRKGSTTNGDKFYDNLLQKSLTHFDKQCIDDLIYLSKKRVPGESNDVSFWIKDAAGIRSTFMETVAFDDAYDHWLKNPKNLAWLWLAVYTIKYGDLSQQNALIQGVLNIVPSDLGFIPLREALISHFADIKVSDLDVNQKRILIKDTLAELPNGGDFSATVSLLNARLKLATSLNDYIKYAFFFPSKKLQSCLSNSNANEVQSHYVANYILDDAAKTISKLPPSMLIELAEMPNLPDNYRPVIYANLWVRSFLFKDKNLEESVSENAMKYNPELTDSITQIAKSPNEDERKKLFLKTLLNFPMLGPIINLKLYETWTADLDKHSESILDKHQNFDSSYNNWYWKSCGKKCNKKPPAFLTAEQLTEYSKQMALLKNLEDANKYINETLLELVNRHPNDEQYAELLALYIKYTKYVSGGSKNAFMALKKHYPNTEWAKNTKYFY